MLWRGRRSFWFPSPVVFASGNSHGEGCLLILLLGLDTWSTGSAKDEYPSAAISASKNSGQGKLEALPYAFQHLGLWGATKHFKWSLKLSTYSNILTTIWIGNLRHNICQTLTCILITVIFHLEYFVLFSPYLVQIDKTYMPSFTQFVGIIICKMLFTSLKLPNLPKLFHSTSASSSCQKVLWYNYSTSG